MEDLVATQIEENLTSVSATQENSQLSERTTEDQTPESADTPSNLKVTEGGKKNKKLVKKLNKAKREMIKEFKTRCLSPQYDRVMAVTCQADILISNQKQTKEQYSKADESSDATGSEGAELNSDEEFEDYRVDGYHPTHTG